MIFHIVILIRLGSISQIRCSAFCLNGARFMGLPRSAPRSSVYYTYFNRLSFPPTLRIRNVQNITQQRKRWIVSYSGIWRHVVRWVSTEVSEEHIASIFRVEVISSTRNQQASRWRRDFPPTRRLSLNGLHGVISQKMILFITTAVKTSNPTKEKI
jgi:hypothetical protein